MVDDLAHAPQEWRFKRAASPGYKESAISFSPAIAAKTAEPVGEWIEGEIPFLAYRGVTEDNGSQDFSGFVNGSNLDNNSTIYQGGLLNNERTLFYFPPQWESEFSRVDFGDFEGSQPDPGLATFFIKPDFTEAPGPFFKGNGYNSTEVHELETPIRADYFYFRQTYPAPAEIKFYGRRRNVPIISWARTTKPAQDIFGVVKYVYDINKPSFQGLDQAKLAIADSVHVYRDYVDLYTIMERVDEVATGRVGLQPCPGGYWSLDDQYENRKAAGKRVVFCLKGSEGSPVYQQALKQAVIRYGPNKNIPLSEVSIITDGPARNEVKIGLDLVHYYQLGNEPTRWWKGRADLVNQTNLEGMMTTEELALMWATSAATIRSVDPTAYIIGSGMPSNKPAFIVSMAYWWKKMGLTKCPVNAWAYHEYNNEEGIQNQSGGEPKGVCPEMAGMHERADNLQQVLHEQFPGEGIELWITETGYSVQHPVTGNQNNIAKNFPDRSNRLTQKDWSCRTALVCLRKSLAGNTFYQSYNDYGFQFKPDINWPWDLTCGIWDEDAQGNLSKFPVAWGLEQMRDLLFDYHMTVPAVYPGPAVLEDKFEKPGSSTLIYSLVSPTQDRTVVPYSFTVPAGKTGKLLRLSDNSATPIETPLNVGPNTINVTEDPCFVVVS
jgi:hypothetical protein